MPVWGYATSAIDRSGVSVVIRRLSGFAREAFRGAESLFGNTRDHEPLGRGWELFINARDSKPFGEAENSLVEAQD
ncbi:hypothetical protein BHE74_00009263 [Ensete ventricosum]|nr:hypothetical protein BHE74_00009263 [Ensete ventricosum]